MRVELIEEPQAIAALQPHWQSVYKADPEATYFLSFEWQFGTAASIGCDAFVLAVRAPEDDSDYVAFLPIRLITDSGPEGYYNELHLTGNKTSDYNGFICRPEFEETAVPALATVLRRMNWRRLIMRYIPTSDRRLKLFLSPFSAGEVTLERLSMIEPDGVDISVCPYADLGSDWDDYLTRSVSKNTRQKIRRFLRKVEGPEDYRFTHATAETLDRDIEALNRLWAIKWGESKGDRLENILRTHWYLLHSAFDTGTLFMPMLWHRDRLVAIYAILVDQQKKAFNFFVSARDLTFREVPAGLVLHAYAIRHAIAEGFTRYDFLRGNEPYKYSFATGETKIRSVRIKTRNGRNLGGKLDRRCLGHVFARSKADYRAGRLAGARLGLAQILQQVPDHAGVLYTTGLTLARLGEFGLAGGAFTKLAARRPGSLKAWLRAEAARLAGLQPAEVPEAVSSGVLQRYPGEVRMPLILGRALLRLGCAAQAGAVFETALQEHPGNTGLQAALAGAQRSRKAAMAKQYELRIRRQIRTDAALGKTPAEFGGVPRSIPPAAAGGELECFPLLGLSRKKEETALTGVLAGAGLPG